jgi:hypothetical protein
VPFKKLRPTPPSSVRIADVLDGVPLSVWNSKDASAEAFQVFASLRWTVVPIEGSNPYMPRPVLSPFALFAI